MLKKHNKHGPMRWVAGLLALPAGNTGLSDTTVPTSYVGFSAVSDVVENRVSVRNYGIYKILFQPNGADGGSTAAKEEIEFNESYTLPANGYTKKGYHYTSWNTKADETCTSYPDKASVKNLSDVNGAVVTLYAQWEGNPYTVTLDKGQDFVRTPK